MVKTSKKQMRKVGLIGCGAIGTVLAEAIERKIVVCDELIVYDFDVSRAEQLKKMLKFPTIIVSGVDELIKLRPEVIVEAASQQAAKDYVPKIVAADIELIVMSTGALLDLAVDMSKGACAFRCNRWIRCYRERCPNWRDRSHINLTQNPKSSRHRNQSSQSYV